MNETADVLDIEYANWRKKIKRGENDHVIIGNVNLREILKYQAEYYNQQEADLKQLCDKKKAKKEPRKKPDIKKLSARFDNERAKRKWNG